MPHYDRHTDLAGASDVPENAPRGAPDEEAMKDAAEALRQAEIEGVQPAPEREPIDPAELDHMTLDDLQALAQQVGVPDRESITDRDELIAAIRQHL